MKRILSLLLAALLSTIILTGCSNDSVPKIGISQYGENASLDNCREGFIQGLIKSGLVEGEDFVIDYQNAGFDNSINTQIAQTFVSKNMDLLVGIATPSATALYAATEAKDIPIIFTAVTDPVEAKLDKGNITGTSDKLPIDAQLELIRAMQPDAKKIGIPYTVSEPNSISAIAEYEEKAASYGFTIDAIGITQQSEVTQAIDTLISRNVDAFSNLTDNNVVGVLSTILDKTNAALIPVYGSEIEQVKLGCIAAAGIDYVELGIRTGEIAAQVLTGEIKATDFPYETIKDYHIYTNKDALAELNIELPKSIEDKTIHVKYD